jgi:hypothetical protein
MGCTCARPTHEHLFNDFTKSIRVRTLSPSDLSLVLKNKKLKFELLLKNNLISPEQEETHGPYYRDIYSEVELDTNEKMIFYSSLLLLCQKDVSGLKKGLKEIGSIFDNKIKTDPTTKVIMVEKELLIKLLQYYVKQLSMYIIKHVSSQSSDKEQFEKHFNTLYNKNSVEAYVEKFLSDYNDEFVNMDSFLSDKNIDMLSDDHFIRIELEKVSNTISLNNQK